jgi:hypothetical protein
MNITDKLLGVSVDAQTTERHYAAHRVDYDADNGLRALFLEESDGVDTQTLDDYLDAGRIDDRSEPVTSSDGTTSENRFALVEDNLTRDALTAELDALDVPYEITDVSVSEKERLIIEREGARNEREIKQALATRGTLLDRTLIKDSSKEPIARAIVELESSDAELSAAFGEMYHVMSGETPQETLDRLAE